MKQVFYHRRWPISVLLATAAHGLIFFLLGTQWHNDAIVATQNAAPMVIKLAPLAYNNASVNDIAPVPEQKEKQKNQQRKERVKKKKRLDIPKIPQSNEANITEVKQTEKNEPEKNEPEKIADNIEIDDVEVDDEVEQEVLNSVAEIASPLVEAENQQVESSALNQGHQRTVQHQVEMNWQNKVMLHLAQKKRYPRVARQRKQEGTVFVRFDVDKTGNVENIEVIKQSKFSLLNKEAVAVVARSAPLPLPPNNFFVNKKKIVIPIKFYLL